MTFRFLRDMRTFDAEDGTGAAPEPDRVATLEQRLARLSRAVESIASTSQKSDADRRQRDAEAQIQKVVSEADTRVKAAETKLRQAYENGEASEIASASAELSLAAANKTRVDVEVQTFRNSQKPAAAQKGNDSNLRSFREKNKTWYGIDADMTQAAFEADKNIQAAGALEVGSQEYFSAIESHVRRKFPDRFSGGANAGQSTGQRGAGMRSNTSGRNETRIPASVADGYRRMGIRVDDPDVAKKMVAARQVAVSKGFLPEQVAGGRIIER